MERTVTQTSMNVPLDLAFTMALALMASITTLATAGALDTRAHNAKMTSTSAPRMQYARTGCATIRWAHILVTARSLGTKAVTAKLILMNVQNRLAGMAGVATTLMALTYARARLVLQVNPVS